MVDIVFCYLNPAPVGMGRTALRSLYSNVLNEPLPDRIAEL
jgi:Anti-sigma factor NepR